MALANSWMLTTKKLAKRCL